MTPSRRAFLTQSGTLVASRLFPGLSERGDLSATVNVWNHGAKGDGVSPDTRSIQAAIDVGGVSGGTVYFPPGKYVCGTLRLRSDVTLHLDADATLIASSDDTDFDPPERLPYESFADSETTDFRFALLQGQDLHRVSILGPGRIDGHRTRRGGPKLIAFKHCRDIRIRDLILVNAPNYNISLLGCDHVDIVGVRILNGYSDGIDPDCCRQVRITNCHIESDDDAVAIKTSFALGVRRPTEDVMVTACELSTIHNGLKLGTESAGDFTRIVFSDCTIVGRPHAWKGRLSSGIALETVDGAHLRGVRVSDIRLVNVRTPIFIRLGERGHSQTTPKAGTLTDVSISNVVATGGIMASSITGVPGHPVSGVSLKNIRTVVTGRHTTYRAPEDVPERRRSYPDAYMFRSLPAYGIYCRHVRNLTLEQVDLAIARPDARSAVVLDDVHDATLQTIRATAPAGVEPLFLLRSVQGCVVRGASPQAGAKTFVRLSGADTRGVHLVSNDFSRVDKIAVIDTEVASSALLVDGRTLLEHRDGRRRSS